MRRSFERLKMVLNLQRQQMHHEAN
jgi:hypothetical protein